MSIQEAQIRRFMTDDKAAREMVEVADEFAKSLVKEMDRQRGGWRNRRDALTTSQIRNAYGGMKKIEMQGWNTRTERALLLLKPRLAYAAGRHRGAVKELSDVIGKAIDNVRDGESFQRFCQFFEAIVAYHKAHGGR